MCRTVSNIILKNTPNTSCQHCDISNKSLLWAINHNSYFAEFIWAGKCCCTVTVIWRTCWYSRWVSPTHVEVCFSFLNLFTNLHRINYRKLTLEQQNIKFAKALEEFHHTCDALETNIVSSYQGWVSFIVWKLLDSFICRWLQELHISKLMKAASSRAIQIFQPLTYHHKFIQTIYHMLGLK